MGLKETMTNMQKYIGMLAKDLTKAATGNKAAAQRVRTGSIKFSKVAKLFRKESVKAEKNGAFKKVKKTPKKKKAAKKKVCKKPCKRKPVKKAKKKAKKGKRK